MIDTDFSDWPESYKYNGTTYVHLCDVHHSDYGIPRKQWSFFDTPDNGILAGKKAVLHSKKQVVTYCDCRSCEGHTEWVDVPESERYWLPDPMPFYMPVLENKPTELMRVLSRLGRG
jgi:hypothetical protein